MFTAIEAQRIITSTGAHPITDGVIVIGSGGEIEALGPRREVEIPTNARRISVPRHTALPGLFDMHTHLLSSTDEEARKGNTVEAVTDQAIRAIANAERCIRHGVTTVRDAGARHGGIFRIKAAIDRGDLLGPRIIAAGEGISMTGGHGHNSAAAEADGPEEVRKVARRQLAAGAQWIKLMAMGGAGSPGEGIEDQQLTVEEMRAAADEAHKRGRRVMAHVSNADGARLAIEAGVDCIEHGLVLDKAVAMEMAQKGIYYDPTLEAYERMVRLGTEVGYYDYMVKRAGPYLGPHRRSFELAVAAGVRIVAGTDAGDHFWPLGDIADELRRMVAFGMEPVAAIDAATRWAAECAGVGEQLGTLEPGRIADILVVEGDPLTDLAALDEVRLVFKQGRLVVGPPDNTSTLQ